MVVVLYCRSTDTIYIVHSPSSWETGVKIEERMREIYGDKVYRLNTGVESERELAERIINDEFCVEIEN